MLSSRLPSPKKRLTLSGLLAGVTVMTLMTLIYGPILDRGMPRYFLGPYPFNLTRRTRRIEQGARTYAAFQLMIGVGFVESS
jgi:hypothetical protein